MHAHTQAEMRCDGLGLLLCERPAPFAGVGCSSQSGHVTLLSLMLLAWTDMAEQYYCALFDGLSISTASSASTWDELHADLGMGST